MRANQICMNIREYLREKKCELTLARLLGEVLPRIVVSVRRAIEKGSAQVVGSQNASGEQQLALDVQANRIFRKELEKSGLVHSLASEEEPDEVAISSLAPFTVAFDPLDGSSLIDANFTVGSIAGIYPSGKLIGRCGDEQLASLIAVYGPRTTLLLTIKKGVAEFILDGEDFVLLKDGHAFAKEPRYFAPGNLRAAAQRTDYLNLTNEWIRRKLTLRYSGGMVPDVYHMFVKGSGIFAYPGYREAPEGKLRLAFECAPIALLVEQASGAASDGMGRILEKKIEMIHQRTPVFMGSSDAVDEAVKALGDR